MPIFHVVFCFTRFPIEMDEFLWWLSHIPLWFDPCAVDPPKCIQDRAQEEELALDQAFDFLGAPEVNRSQGCRVKMFFGCFPFKVRHLKLTKLVAGSRVKDRLVNKICWIPWNMWVVSWQKNHVTEIDLFYRRAFWILIIGKNGGTLGMVPLVINPMYTLYSRYLLGIFPFKGLLGGFKQQGYHPKGTSIFPMN